ncbi:MAG: MFS transporter [Chitinophagales bacterium]
MRDGVFMLSGLFVIFYAISFFQLFSGLPLYYKQEYAMDEKGIGLLLALNGVIVFCLEMILVFNLEKKFAVRTLIITGCLLLATGYFIFNMYHGIIVLIISMVLLSLSEIFAMPFMMSYIIARADAANRGNYIGLYTIFWSIATILAPLISSHTIESFSFSTLWWILGSLSVGTSVGFGFAMRTPRAKTLHTVSSD